ncbi:hypothetical protein [Ekhidna sp.]|uniref:hypothetical protein n=1 Tax=Ekhidna sp. TaxID=2608089 RepID=UPI003BA9967A
MRYLLGICILVSLSSCTDKDLKKENQELLTITKNLTETVEELKLQVEKQQELAMNAAAEARMAEAEAMLHMEKARANIDEAQKQYQLAEELQKKLKDCQ